jgi:hypothetical protein
LKFIALETAGRLARLIEYDPAFFAHHFDHSLDFGVRSILRLIAELRPLPIVSLACCVPRPLTLTAEVHLDEGKTSVFQHRTGRWLEIRRVRFQAHRLRLVRREERKQDECESDGYLGNVG